MNVENNMDRVFDKCGSFKNNRNYKETVANSKEGATAILWMHKKESLENWSITSQEKQIKAMSNVLIVI